MRGRWLLALASAVVVLGAAGAAWAHVYPYAFGRHHQERRLIWQASAERRLDPWLVTAVIEVESHFRADAVSRRGAVGLMQILPPTGRWVESQAHIHGALANPAVNIAIGTWYLAYLSRLFQGRMVLVLAAYNGGPETVEQWEQQGRFDRDDDSTARIPYPETRAFVSKVLWNDHLFHWLAHA